MSSLPLLIWLPPSAHSHMQSAHSWDPSPAVMESILITDCIAVLNNMQDATHRVTIFNSTWVYLKHKSCNKRYISDEQLRAMELCIYHDIKAQVECLEGERISHICRCTGSQRWHEGDRQNDLVWVKQGTGWCYGALNRCLPWQLQRLFKINLHNKDGAFVEYWFTLELTTIPENLSNLDPISKFVQVKNALAAIALHVFSMGNMAGYPHAIPEIATSSNTGSGRNQRWIVISHIDLASCNDDYD